MNLRKRKIKVQLFEEQGAEGWGWDNRPQWRWRIKSGNGRIVAVSGEGFDTPYNARRAVQEFGEMMGVHIKWEEAE